MYFGLRSPVYVGFNWFRHRSLPKLRPSQPLVYFPNYKLGFLNRVRLRYVSNFYRNDRRI